LLRPGENKLPLNLGRDNWVGVAQDGCIGLSLVRIGWSGLPGAPKSPILVPGSEWYTDETAARERLKKLTDEGKDYLLVAAQLAIRGSIRKAKDLLGVGPIDIRKVPYDVGAKVGDFNYSTWLDGYWKYMNHQWETCDDPKDLPHVRHAEKLPRLEGNKLTLYGVVPHRPWKK
jgi:hypothetical protein